ncbi:MAG TPA: hypothetical protein VGF24_19120 [Vicinamibacterales bacterium]
MIEHIWRSRAALADLHRRLIALDDHKEIHGFLLTLPADENLRRITRRQDARAIDEREFEVRTYAAEREALAGRTDVGEPFDLSALPSELVTMLLRRLGLR